MVFDQGEQTEGRLMNRRQRRRLDRQIHAMLAAAHADGKRWAVHGLKDACADCAAVGSIRGAPGSPMIWADIRHDPCCPAFNGIVPWGFAS